MARVPDIVREHGGAEPGRQRDPAIVIRAALRGRRVSFLLILRKRPRWDRREHANGPDHCQESEPTAVTYITSHRIVLSWLNMSPIAANLWKRARNGLAAIAATGPALRQTRRRDGRLGGGCARTSRRGGPMPV